MGRHEVRVVEPDGGEVRFGLRAYDFSRYVIGWSTSQEISLVALDPGPYRARIVLVDGPNEVVASEGAGWVGDAEVPVLMLDNLAVDTSRDCRTPGHHDN
jgi:hypothetical protein